MVSRRYQNKTADEIGDTMRAESITSVAVAPATGSGPLGLLAIGSRKPDAFGQEDLDLLNAD